MDKNVKIVVLEEAVQPKDRRLGSRMDRTKALNAIRESGAKIRHDSGGRVLLVEVPEKVEKDLAKRLTGARLVPADTDLKDSVRDMDPTEALFVAALKIRTSKSYREAKRLRKFGETPEEKLLLTGSCVREGF